MALNTILGQLLQEVKPPEPDDHETVPRDEWVQVTIPATDQMGDPFPIIRENNYEFKPGEVYWMPPGYATSVQERILVHNKAQIRRLQPHKDMDAVNKHPLA